MLINIGLLVSKKSQAMDKCAPAEWWKILISIYKARLCMRGCVRVCVSPLNCRPDRAKI